MDTTTKPTTNVTGTSARRASARWIALLSRMWAWIFLLILVIFFSLAAPYFFSVASAMNILTTASPILLMALGQTFVIISGGIDLSVGWTMGVASVFSALVMRHLFDNGMSEWPAVGLGLLAGIAISLLPGLINGLLIAWIKVPSFIATLGMFNVARGVAMLACGGIVVAGLPPHLTNVGNGNLFYLLRGNLYFFQQPENLAVGDLREIIKFFPFPVIVTIIVTLICAFLLARTQFGRRTYAIGGNKEAAIRAGIPVKSHLIRIYMLSAALTGIAGVLYTTRFTAGSHQAGEAQLLDTVAAVVIGGASMFGGSGNIIGTVVGALILSIMTTGLVIMNVPPFWQFVAVGIVVVLAVLIDQLRGMIEREQS